MFENEGKELLTRIELLLSNADANKKLDVLYKCLDVLDGKTASLLTFNAILAAVFVLLLDQQIKGQSAPEMSDVLNMLGLALTLVSALVCLYVAQIAWRFFKRLGNSSNPRFSDELGGLAIAVESRTFLYRRAREFSILAMIFLIVALVVKAFF